MGTVIASMIDQLTADEKDQVVDYMQYVLSKRKKYTLLDGYKIFLEIREEAKKNGTAGMTMDEINAEIEKMHSERHNKWSIM